MEKAGVSAVLSSEVHLFYIMLWKQSLMFQYNLYSIDPETEESENW